MIKSNNFEISKEAPTYFIADIAANHDGDLERALLLIELAAKSGANAAKFQHFKASKIVSRVGFEKDLSSKMAHQANWSKSVWDVYTDAEVPLNWTKTLINKCEELGIDFFTAPYDLESINSFGNLIPFFKVGSGDLNYIQALKEMSKYGKPIFLATGASTLDEVKRTVEYLENQECKIVIMQCNTNYSGAISNSKYINLRVLNEYGRLFPNTILGLSDHTKSDTTVLGAVAIGAKVIEKHFTDDTNRVGPDHKFSITPNEWAQMVNRVRELELSLGDGHKKVEINEIESRIVQRRALRTTHYLSKGHVLTEDDVIALRPMPEKGIDPFLIYEIIGRRINKNLESDCLIKYEDLD